MLVQIAAMTITAALASSPSSSSSFIDASKISSSSDSPSSSYSVSNTTAVPASSTMKSSLLSRFFGTDEPSYSLRLLSLSATESSDTTSNSSLRRSNRRRQTKALKLSSNSGSNSLDELFDSRDEFGGSSGGGGTAFDLFSKTNGDDISNKKYGKPYSSSHHHDHHQHSSHSSMNHHKSSSSSSLTSNWPTSEEQCVPIGECQMCPPSSSLKRKSSMKVKDDRNGKVVGMEEYQVCQSSKRRQQFECTVLILENGSSEKTPRSRLEYRPCWHTETDEQFRMLRMQLICLLIGIWSMRTVRRQKLASASLFDQRRMARNRSGPSGVQSSGGGSSSNNSSNGNGNVGMLGKGGGGGNVRYSSLPTREEPSNDMRNIDQQQPPSRNMNGMMAKAFGKVPKSPAPPPSPSLLQTV